MKIITKPFAAVRWADAHSAGSTTELSEFELPHAPSHYTLYGFVLKHDAAGITMASEHSDQATYRGICFVPAGMIVEVLYVKLQPVKAKKAAAVELSGT